MPGELFDAAPRSPEAQELFDRGLERLHQLGLLDSAGIVLQGPYDYCNGTLAEMAGIDSELIQAGLEETVADALAAGEDVNTAFLRDYKKQIKKGDDRQPEVMDVSKEVADFTQKKTLNPAPTR